MKNLSKKKKTQVAPESGPPGGGETGTSSPLFDDFDEELCMELEEVGKELDRYKEESSRVPGSGGGSSPSVVLRESSSPSLECLPHVATKASPPTK